MLGENKWSMHRMLSYELRQHRQRVTVWYRPSIPRDKLGPLQNLLLHSCSLWEFIGIHTPIQSCFPSPPAHALFSKLRSFCHCYTIGLWSYTKWVLASSYTLLYLPLHNHTHVYDGKVFKNIMYLVIYAYQYELLSFMDFVVRFWYAKVYHVFALAQF